MFTSFTDLTPHTEAIRTTVRAVSVAYDLGLPMPTVATPLYTATLAGFGGAR